MHWQPTASIELLALRARLLGRLRELFAERKTMEVETPILSAAASTDSNLHSMKTCIDATGPMYLHTSPEFPMKRLLAAGCQDIYQLCRVFRDGESGRLHNPEFTLLEWYRVGFSLEQMMEDVIEIILACLQLSDRQMQPGFHSLTYQQAFQDFAGIDPLKREWNDIVLCCDQYGIEIPPSMNTDHIDDGLDLVLSHVVMPALIGTELVFIYEYPASQAALAELSRSDPRVALRFELFYKGIELVNGFEELTNANEQEGRFAAENLARAKRGFEPMPVDQRMLDALKSGIPGCAGAALGVDRLLMCMTGRDSIQDVLAFPVDRA